MPNDQDRKEKEYLEANANHAPKTQRHSAFYFVLFLCVSFSAFGYVWQEWQETLFVQESSLLTGSDGVSHHAVMGMRIRAWEDEKPAQQIVKGVYLTAYSAGSQKKVDEIIALLDATELNAIVIDIKDYSGKILYESELSLVNQYDTDEGRIGDVALLIEKLHDHDIYVIARQTVFQDPVLAEKKPEWALQSKSGGLWRDHKGLAWVDPTNKHIWEYNRDIAKEAISFGFDEINFDYVRFPTDGNMSMVVYTNGEKARHEVMREFFEYISAELAEEPALMSLDLFGFVMERHDGMSIGQRLEDTVDVVDYVSPMMYPSHYPSGHLGLSNPAEHPATVIDNGMEKGAPYFVETRAQVRPWLQAFNLGATYGAENIRAQIDAVEKYPNAGWFLWNASNRYSSAGLLGGEN